MAASVTAQRPRLCIVHPNKSAYSETFIHNHLEKLPAQIFGLHTGWFPTLTGDGRRLMPIALALGDGARSRLPPRLRALHERLRDRYLSRYLRSQSIDIVLAEYGPTG